MTSGEYARITASDQHDPGFLSSLGQMTKTVLFERETPAKEGFVTADEPLRQQRAAPLGAVCSRGRPRHSPTPKIAKSRASRLSAGNPASHRLDHGIVGRLSTRKKSNAHASRRKAERQARERPACHFLSYSRGLDKDR